MPTLDALLAHAIQNYPDRIALTLRAEHMRYRDLGAAVERMAGYLSAHVSPGQRVAIVAPNVPALVIGMFATWRLKAVAVPLNARYREYELRRVLQDAQPVAVVSVESYRGYSFARMLSQLLPELPAVRCCCIVDETGEVRNQMQEPGAGAGTALPDMLDPEIGLLLYTSGSTGAPKGALMKHSTETDGAHALNDVLKLSGKDVSIYVVSLAHAFGLMCFLGAIEAGSQIVLVESTFSPGPLIEAIRQHQATILHGSPALFASLLKADPECLRQVRTGYVAGAPCPPELLEQVDGLGCRILNLYGMTEIGAATSCRPGDAAQVRSTTVGRPLPGYEVRVVNDEVQVRGPAITPGYYQQPEQTAAAFDDGWFRTGDLGALDEYGNLSIRGRAKEVIYVAGLSVFPAEVENLLLTHPDVVQAAVIGVPHQTMGEVPRAFVAARPGSNVTPPQLLQFARVRIAGYKLPYAITVLPELPALASGKPNRLALAQLIEERTDAEPTSGTQPAL